MCFDMKKSDRCHRECSSTTPAVAGEERPVQGAGDASVCGGGRGASQPTADSCAICVFHLLLQKCASAEYR